MRTLFSWNARRTTARRHAARRDFLRLERLESRYALSGAAPAAVNDLYHAMVDQPLDITATSGILANDTDAEGDTLSAGLFSGPSNGTLTLNEDGSFHYVPNSGFTGLDSFIYFTSDGTGDSHLAAVTIRVEDSGTPPVAADDSYNVAEDGALNIGLSEGVLGNDTDAEGDTMTAELVAGPANGTLSLAADGSFTYLPNADFSGSDSFTYMASDGSGQSNIATVTLTVDPVNDDPSAANDAFATDEDAPLTIDAASGLLANDADPDGDTLTPTVVSQPLHGTVSVNADGSFSYTPEADFSGLDGFSYLVSDGETDSDVATVTIEVASVNDTPVAVNDELTTAEDTPLEVAAPGVLGNDTDADGDALSAILVAPPQHGTVTLNADGSLLYTPDADFAGIDGFSYLAGDGSAESDVASVTINVTAVNDAPVSVNDEFNIDEDSPLTMDAAGGVLSNDTDADGDPLTVSILNPPSHGTVTLNADGSFSYTPEGNFSGVDGFSYLAGDGTLMSEAASVTINIAPVNDGPIGVEDSFTTDEDTALTVDTAGGVLANDTDAEGDSLTAALVSGPANGTLTLNADGSFEYLPNSGFSGSDSFVYTVSDGELTSEATATITINAVNDAPVATDDSLQVNEDETLAVDAPGILGNDSDPDGDPLTAALVSGPVNGTLTMNADGSLSYTPNANFSGSDSFTYSVSDGTETSNVATVTIDVCPVNDVSVAEDDAYSVDEDQVLTVDAPGVLANDSDADGESLAAAIVTGPANGTVTMNADGSFVYTPAANFSGTDSFVYAAGDGSASDEAMVTITVNPIADAPVAAIDNYSVGEDIVLTVGGEMGVLANDLDPSGGGLTAEVVDAPANGTLVLNADGSFTYTPAANWHGTDSFTYKAVANGEEIISSANIVVEPLNDWPVAMDDELTVTPGSVIAAASIPGGVMANDSDIDLDSLTTSLVEGPEHGTLTLNPDGTFDYVPEEGFTGDDAFRYQLFDGMANSNVATVTIHVMAGEENEAPVSASDSYATTAGVALTVDAAGGVLSNDLDADSDELTATVMASPANGTLAMNADGSFVYTPNAGFIGQDTFTYQASDGTATGAETTVTIDVAGSAALPPAAVDDVFTMAADDVLEVAAPGVLANDTDAEGDPLTAVVVATPEHGTVALDSDGGFVYTPEAGFTGTDSFTYTATDGAGVSNEATVSITIEAAENLRPEAINDSYAVEAGATLDVAGDLGLLLNDIDPEGAPLSASLFSGPLSGSLTLNEDGSFTYTPNEGFTGIDAFLYRVSDGELFSALGAVTIHVNAAAENPEPAPIPEPEPLPDDCMALDENLLDQIVAEGEDPDVIDEILASDPLSKQDFLA